MKQTMKPIGIEEQLMYTTVRLTASNGTCGTGYFFTFTYGDIEVPTIITNKHVVNNNPDETMTFLLHLSSDGESYDGNHAVRLLTHWNFHPTMDLCYTYCSTIDKQIPSITGGKRVFKKSLDFSYILTREKLTELSMSESVVMVGYPNGLWDQIHNYPIFRYGYTAAHPGYDFNYEGIGLVDMACFPGSSGSPILIVNSGVYKEKTGNINIADRVIFLGTLFAGPVYNADGKIIIKNIPVDPKQAYSQTQMMMNLGYYIKSYELDDFRYMIESDLRKNGKI